jgi:hypothetical protein
MRIDFGGKSELKKFLKTWVEMGTLLLNEIFTIIMYWNIQSNTTCIDYVMLRLHVSTMKQSSSGLSNNYLKIKLLFHSRNM